MLFEIFLQEPGWFYTAVCILALIVGSFLNVVIYRLPSMLKQQWKGDCLAFLRDENPESLAAASLEQGQLPVYNLSTPDSHCPKCQRPIKPWENIPVVSYLFLRGKCAGCGTGISLRYPSIEIVSALLAMSCAWYFGVSMLTFWAMLLSWALLVLTMVDFDHQYLPDTITLPFLWMGLLINTHGTFASLEDAVIGAAAGYLVLWTVYQVFKFFTGKEGMGFGDFKLLAMLGAWLGWQSLPGIILMSSLIGSVIGISLVLFFKHQSQKPIPFGPYLASAGWVMLIWGKELNATYLGWISG